MNTIDRKAYRYFAKTTKGEITDLKKFEAYEIMPAYNLGVGYETINFHIKFHQLQINERGYLYQYANSLLCKELRTAYFAKHKQNTRTYYVGNELMVEFLNDESAKYFCYLAGFRRNECITNNAQTKVYVLQAGTMIEKPIGECENTSFGECVMVAYSEKHTYLMSFKQHGYQEVTKMLC